MKETKKWSKQKTKWTLLALVPTIAVPSITLAAIYGANGKDKKEETLSHTLSDKELEDALTEELKKVYADNPELEKQDIEKININDIKKEINSPGITITRSQLRKMIKKLLDNAGATMQSSIREYFNSKEEEAMKKLFADYERKLSDWVTYSKDLSIPDDLLPEDKWLQSSIKRGLDKKVVRKEIHHKEHLILLINELDDQLAYLEELKGAIERAAYACYIKQVKEGKLEQSKKVNMIPITMTKIPDGLFEGFKFKERFNIPSWVTTIGKRAFFGADLSNGITMKDSIVKIEDQAFGVAKINDDFRMPLSVKELGDNVFQGVVLPIGFEINATLFDKITNDNEDIYQIWWDARKSIEEARVSIERGRIDWVDDYPPRYRMERSKYWPLKAYAKN